MLGCSVMGCKSNTLWKIEGISFHTFPYDPEIRKLWRTATNRLNWDPPRGSRIYSRHFNKEDVLHKGWKENISFSVPVKWHAENDSTGFLTLRFRESKFN